MRPRVKNIRRENKIKRNSYGKTHASETVDSLWQYVVFTDEFHYDPSEERPQRQLREQGHRYSSDSVQERAPKQGTKLHGYAWINWHTKMAELGFYNDEFDAKDIDISAPAPPGKPRPSKYETAAEFQRRMADWESKFGPKLHMEASGNHMTGDYYTRKLLPQYIDAWKQVKAAHGRALLQEDGDPSHGKKSKIAPAQRLRGNEGIICLDHPPQSPDLNPIEAIWNIIKQRMRNKPYKDIEDLKRQLQYEWGRITREEVQARIAEMPARCKKLAKKVDQPLIKSALW